MLIQEYLLVPEEEGKVKEFLPNAVQEAAAYWVYFDMTKILVNALREQTRDAHAGGIQYLSASCN